MEPFEYTIPNQPVCYQGQWLDSLLELKYVLSIEDTHAWLREDLKMYYDLETIEPGELPPIKSITPDFLIRNWQTGKASLVEIKPPDYNLHYDLTRKRKIIEDYIELFGYDWSYSLITDVHLPPFKLSKYLTLCRQLPLKKCTHWQTLLQNETRLSDTDYIKYVRDGVTGSGSLERHSLRRSVLVSVP